MVESFTSKGGGSSGKTSWEDKGFRVTKDNMNGIDVTKDDKSIWYSQNSEDNVDMFGDSDDWDDNAILDYLESGGAISKEASEGLRDLCENCKEGTHEYCYIRSRRIR